MSTRNRARPWFRDAPPSLERLMELVRERMDLARERDAMPPHPEKYKSPTELLVDMYERNLKWQMQQVAMYFDEPEPRSPHRVH